MKSLGEVASDAFERADGDLRSSWEAAAFAVIEAWLAGDAAPATERTVCLPTLRCPVSDVQYLDPFDVESLVED